MPSRCSSRCTIRLTAAADTFNSEPAAAKLPLRAAASHALMPLRNSSRRISHPQENSCQAKITQFARAAQARQKSQGDFRMTPLLIGALGLLMVATAFLSGLFGMDGGLSLLGVTPFMARLTPPGLKPDPESLWQGTFYGSICMGLMLMTGVSGPLMDTFFLGGNFDRRGIVATKATCQVASHFVKLIYFGGIIDQAATLDPLLAGVAVAASMLGTTLARRILEAMTELQFRTWARRLITTVAGYYILYGSWLLLARRR